MLAAARAAANPARDPSGIHLLRACELLAAGEAEAGYHLLDDVFRGNDTDLLAGALLLLVAVSVHRTEEAAAIARRLYTQHPELMFGADLVEVFGREARDADADRVIREWIELAPESAGARVQLARIEAGAGRLDEARARAREALSIHRDREDALPDLFEALVETDQISDGRAIVEHRAFGYQSELAQCLELARARAPLVADLEGGPARDVARRRMLRAAAVADCGSAPRAVAARFSAFEENTASLVALGLCAWKVRELDLARRSFERAARRWSSVNANQSSPYHAVLARFHLAGVLAELGDRAAARAAYEAFLRCWDQPDRPVPEVAVARQMLDGGALAP